MVFLSYTYSVVLARFFIVWALISAPVSSSHGTAALPPQPAACGEKSGHDSQRKRAAREREPAVGEVAKRHAAVERRHGEQVKRAEQHACARKAVKPKLSGEGGKRKAGRRTGKTDCGASAAALWQGAAKHGAAGGKRQPKHPTARKGQHQHMPQLVYGRGKQEQRQGIGFVHTPERGQQHEEPVADLKPFHLKLGQVIGWVKGGAILPQLKVQVRAGRVAGLADACDFLPAAYRIAHLGRDAAAVRVKRGKAVVVVYN